MIWFWAIFRQINIIFHNIKSWFDKKAVFWIAFKRAKRVDLLQYIWLYPQFTLCIMLLVIGFGIYRLIKYIIFRHNKITSFMCSMHNKLYSNIHIAMNKQLFTWILFLFMSFSKFFCSDIPLIEYDSKPMGYIFVNYAYLQWGS